MWSKCKKIKEALLSVTDNVGHYEAIHKTDKYIVWAEDSEGSSVEGDDRKINQRLTILQKKKTMLLWSRYRRR